MSKFRVGQLFDESFVGLSPDTIKDTLDSTCYKVREGAYNKKLSAEEIQVAKSDLADVSIKLAKIAEDKKEVMDDFKDKVKGPESEKQHLLSAIRLGSVRMDGLIFEIDEQEENTMYIFDEQGICIDSRPLLPNEKQQKIRAINKKQA